MEKILICLTEEEVETWRTERSSKAAGFRIEVKNFARHLAKETGLPVEVQTPPEYNPQYDDPKPTCLWP